MAVLFVMRPALTITHDHSIEPPDMPHTLSNKINHRSPSRKSFTNTRRYSPRTPCVSQVPDRLFT